MAASLYIVVEGEDPGFDIFVNGRALARNEDALERLAETLRVTPLLHFFSADENSMCILLEQGSGDPEWAHHLPQPQWFDPAAGLATVRALIGFLASTPVSFGSETPPVSRGASRIRAGTRKGGEIQAALAPGCQLALRSEDQPASYRINPLWRKHISHALNLCTDTLATSLRSAHSRDPCGRRGRGSIRRRRLVPQAQETPKRSSRNT